MRYSEYKVFIDEDRADEFRKLVTDQFGAAVELSWIDWHED